MSGICDSLSGVKYKYCSDLVAQCEKDGDPIVLDTHDGNKTNFQSQSACKNFAIFRVKTGVPEKFIKNTQAKDTPGQKEDSKDKDFEKVTVHNCMVGHFGSLDAERPGWLDSSVPEHYVECIDSDPRSAGKDLYTAVLHARTRTQALQHYCPDDKVDMSQYAIYDYVDKKDDLFCFHVFFEWSWISCLGMKKTFVCECE